MGKIDTKYRIGDIVQDTNGNQGVVCILWNDGNIDSTYDAKLWWENEKVKLER